MALPNKNVFNLYESLKYNFLFNNDINSIHILLNLYDLEENIRNIFPKYVSIRNLRKSINRALRKRRGSQLIALNLSNLVHEEINRLELFLYLEGYKTGYMNTRIVNDLERLTLKYYPIEYLYNNKYLFHFETSNNEVLELKKTINSDLNKEEKRYKRLYNLMYKYTYTAIKPKVFSLNKYLDKQMAMDLDLYDINIKEDVPLLTKDDLNEIYIELFKIILKNGFKLYKNAYWYGLNDRVLKRYR
ncbi:hypothetical protein [Paratissierella segnis]|uniref:Uncharacterized protein n=1 Tax=Paratissierella segnis TaxID=2763679 RepID=A0A926EY84_9FIRM|nr:hypothetical protein [Paratissierella segnis]MBC8588697.1 hypothetical protein [Paratissierella segnis]